MTSSPLLLPVIPHDKIQGWPKHNDAPEIGYVDAVDAFTQAWPTDAHFAAYSVPRVRRRLTLDAVGGLTGGWLMVALVIDVDHPWKKEKPKDAAGREAKRLRVEAWWAEELSKLAALDTTHPGAFIYRSRSGGYRLVWRLASPFVIRTIDDKEAWRVRYRRELLYLARRWGIVGDTACADITRLYRLPFVTPEEGPPTAPELRGDPAALGAWGHEPGADELPDDVAMARSLATMKPKLWRPTLQALAPERVGQEGQGPAPELRPEDQDEERLHKRAAAYLASMAPSIEGAGGNAALWAAALAMVRGFNLGAETGASILERDFNPRCRPPWDQTEIRRTCRNAADRGEQAWGYLRDAEGGEKGLNHKPSQRRQRSTRAAGGTVIGAELHHIKTTTGPSSSAAGADQTTNEGGPMPDKTATDHDQGDEGRGPTSGPRNSPPNEWDNRPVVLVDFETGQRIREAEAALAARDDLNLYVRDGRLVSVETRASRRRTMRDDTGSPLARDLSLAALRAMLTDTVRFEQMVPAKDDKGKIIRDEDGKPEMVPVRCRPHDDISKGLHQATEWLELRDLVGIARAPFLASLDGEVVASSGYHEPSGYLLAMPQGYGTVEVPKQPTQADAAVALAELQDLLSGFPFASPRDESAALAAILTLVARPALGGENVPAFVFEANMPAAGKTLLADTIAIIGTGALSPKHGFTRDDQEMEKTLGSLAGEARALVCFDNVTETIGGSKLDLALTCNGSFSYRLLGHNRTVQSAWRSVVFFTGNNPTIGGDIGRRLLVCRLNCPEERPAKRQGFRYKLPEHAKQNRGHLAGLALTILRAFCLVPTDQRPRVSPMGSFEAWAQLVGGALLWLGKADPLEAIADEREEGADPHQMAHAALLEHWNKLEKHPRSVLRWGPDGLAARAAIDALYPQGTAGAGDEMDDLREALEVLAPPAPGRPPSVARLGYALRHIRERPANGRTLVGKPDRKGVMAWRVMALVGGTKKTHETPRSAGDAGDAGDVSSQSRSPARSREMDNETTNEGGEHEAPPQTDGKHPRQSPASPAPSVTPPPVSTDPANEAGEYIEDFPVEGAEE